jgi:hypothetical protein
MVMVIAAALAILMQTLFLQTRADVRRGNTLLSRERLRRMAEEKFTRDFSALRHDKDGARVSTTPVTFADGEAQSRIEPVPALPGVDGGFYLVVTATLTHLNAAPPHHIQLETIVTWPVPPPPIDPPVSQMGHKTAAETIEEQLRAASLPEEQVQQAKAEVLSQLEKMFGSQADSMVLSVETNEYRNPAANVPVPADASDAFYLQPLTVLNSAGGPKIYVWKETYD